MASEVDATTEAAPRTILHVDMDAFFASVELLRHPELRGRPVVVGGGGRRGVVAAASYEARSFGIRSAMPGSRARQLCPDAVFLEGDHAHYREVSSEIMAIMRRFTPLVEPLSLDEAFLDVTSSRRLFGRGTSIAHTLRAAIRDETGLWCSAGVAPNKFIAKLCSEQAKPTPSRAGPVPGSGVFVVAPGRELEFLHPLPARSLWGVGAATMSKLERLGIGTVGDLAATDLGLLERSLGTATGRHLHALAHGRDDRTVEPNQQVKSISHEETYEYDRHDRGDLEVELLKMSDAVATRLRTAELFGRTVSIKVRFADFRTITRQATLDRATDTSADIVRTARALLTEVDVSPGVRLLGVGVSGLEQDQPEQLSFDRLTDDGVDSNPSEWRRADQAIDEIRRRYGTTSIGPASLVDPESGLRTRVRNDKPWG